MNKSERSDCDAFKANKIDLASEWEREKEKNTFELFFFLISEIKFPNTCSTSAEGNLADVRFI